MKLLSDMLLNATFGFKPKHNQWMNWQLRNMCMKLPAMLKEVCFAYTFIRSMRCKISETLAQQQLL
jgi:hypothetical protein